jgi:hypothetical protein
MMLLNAAVLNYYMWVGMYGLLDNEAQGIDSWRNVLLGYTDQSAIMATENARAYLISMAADKEVYSSMNRSAFVTFDTSPMYYVEELADFEVLERGYSNRLPIKGIHPYVSGSLVLSSVSGQVDGLAHLSQDQSFGLDAYGTTDTRSALQLVNAYRLFGHDINMVNDRTREVITTYANKRECVISPAPVLTAVRANELLGISATGVRDGRHDTVPAPDNLRSMGILKLSFSMPTIEAVEWRKRTRPLASALNLPGRRKPITFKVLPGTAFRKVVMGVKNVRDSNVGDFPMSVTLPTPTLPTSTETRQRAVASTQEEGGPAEDAE